MCSLENAIETMDKSVLVSHEVFKFLIDEYRNAHTEDAVTALLDNQDIGVATEGEIITLLKSYRYDQEEMEKLKKRNNDLKEHILALQGSANAFQVSRCESCQESQRADKELEKLNEMVDKYNELAHKYNTLDSATLSQIKVHHFPDEIPTIPKDDTCVSLYLFDDNGSSEPICKLNDRSIWYQSEIDIAFRKGNKPCYFIYASDVMDAINKSVNLRRLAGLDQFSKATSYCPSCGAPIPTPEPCKTYDDVVKRDG